MERLTDTVRGGRQMNGATLPMTADDHRLARDLAAETGRRLLALRAEGGEPASLRAAGDLLAHEYLMAELTRLRAGDAILSEEGKDDPARLSAERVWIVDPLDGTREFGEAGRTDWAVHVALWERGQLTAGAVALPALQETLSTAEPPPGRREAEPGTNGDRLRIVISRSRPRPSSSGSPGPPERNSSRSGRPAPRSPRWYAARWMPTCTPAASTSGTRQRPWPWLAPRDCTRHVSTAAS